MKTSKKVTGRKLEEENPSLLEALAARKKKSFAKKTASFKYTSLS